MITIRLFARLREQIGQPLLQWELSEPMTIRALLDALITDDFRWQTLTETEVLCAVNHQQVTFEQVLKSGDEVAFFPPVTGG
ncbi:MoaD/ThiS family protein [Celerinatantimonas diazotrophica]|uniref:Molybdopterin synthase sulfur carrier subunit n=1 Tax=Celerinatantimonas diazotrophica TaxID=412034 RepID=A0A4R1JAC5_9GAMM|nr:MoaD/ThiS family protein [Celerinatantimonas diazotrophica]TCK47593.1 molybdopterin synthase subunit MoaD [Celerinatantimonas diazotrophica]CAG9296784.1 Molybdopterin synthase sulfur carrier subunit [Celerinatantimonas diazotrophica]